MANFHGNLLYSVHFRHGLMRSECSGAMRALDGRGDAMDLKVLLIVSSDRAINDRRRSMPPSKERLSARACRSANDMAAA